MRGTERAATVYAERDPDLGTRSVVLRATGDGGLVLDGQDLGRGVSSVFGDGLTEYEWSFTLPAERVGVLVAALAIDAASADVHERVAERLRGMTPVEMQDAFRDAGAAFWSRLGD